MDKDKIRAVVEKNFKLLAYLNVRKRINFFNFSKELKSLRKDGCVISNCSKKYRVLLKLRFYSLVLDAVNLTLLSSNRNRV